MIFDSLILAAVTDEIERTIVGGKVERITQPSPLELVLQIYSQGRSHALLLSADAREARVHLTAHRRNNPLQPPPFCMLLRKHLGGAWLTDVRLPRGFQDRVLALEFQATDGARDVLLAETMGRHSNVILTNATGTILGAAKIIPASINRVREIRPGLPYTLPPRQTGKIDPLGHFDPAAVPPPAAGAEAQWLTATFAGVSPLLAQETVRRAHMPLTAASLWYGLNEILNLMRMGEYAPHLLLDAEGGAPEGAYPILLQSVPADRQRAVASLSAALDEAATASEQREAFLHTHDALHTALRRAIQARTRERTETEKGLANAERADEYQQAGELLQAHPSLVAPGAAQAVLPDYYAPLTSTGVPPLRSIALDPALDLRANVERYFKRARKARDSRERLEQRLIELADEIEMLTDAEEDVVTRTTVEQVAALRERVAASLSPQQEAGEERSARTEPAFEGHKIRTYRSPDGWEIFVGETATANDYLTTRVAAPSDIWLHVRAATSAHGVIRTGNRPAAVSPAALQQAAELVAARSEVKHSSLIPVDYTLKKYVRKPRKSPPGMVTYQNEKTLYVTGI